MVPVATVTPTTTSEPTDTQTPVAQLIYVSSSRSGRINAINFRDEDILLYNTLTQQWEIIFDGTDVGVGNADLDAFDLLDDGTILMSFNRPIRFPSLGLVDDSDIVRFVPTTLRSTTSGTFELFFDGSDVGLTTGSEDIDAIAYQADGSLLISTYGRANVPGIQARDEDLLSFQPTSTGEATAGVWSLAFDGSEMSLSQGSEDINAATVDEADALYLNTKGNFQASSQNSMSGDADDVFGCTLNEPTSCFFFAFFDGDTVGFGYPLDGVSFGESVPAVFAARSISELENELEEQEPEQFEVLDDDLVTEDEEFDSYDLAQSFDTELYLPFIAR